MELEAAVVEPSQPAPSKNLHSLKEPTRPCEEAHAKKRIDGAKAEEKARRPCEVVSAIANDGRMPMQGKSLRSGVDPAIQRPPLQASLHSEKEPALREAI